MRYLALRQSFYLVKWQIKKTPLNVDKNRKEWTIEITHYIAQIARYIFHGKTGETFDKSTLQ